MTYTSGLANWLWTIVKGSFQVLNPHRGWWVIWKVTTWNTASSLHMSIDGMVFSHNCQIN